MEFSYKQTKVLFIFSLPVVCVSLRSNKNFYICKAKKHLHFKIFFINNALFTSVFENLQVFFFFIMRLHGYMSASLYPCTIQIQRGPLVETLLHSATGGEKLYRVPLSFRYMLNKVKQSV